MSERIICELTPSGRGAVCVMRVSGPDALNAVGKFFQPAVGPALRSSLDTPDRDQRPRYGYWHSSPSGQADSLPSADGERPSEDVIVLVRSQRDVEIHCHGGRVARQRIISDLRDHGFEPIPSESWVRHHFPDTSSGMAQRLLPYALTVKCLAVLNWQIHGATGATVAAVLRALEERDTAEATRLLQSHLGWLPLASHLTQPWKVVIFGEPNVGKSSLINRIVGFSRSIVFDEPGTTRDLVRARTAITGWPFEFTDSAGIRVGDSTIEREGIAWARDTAAAADLIIEVRDARDPGRWSESIAPAGVPRLIVANKVDLLAPGRTTKAPTAHNDDPDLPAGVIATSAVEGTGVDFLLDSVLAQLIPREPAPGTSVPLCEATTATLRRALHSLSNSDTTGAIELLKELAAEES